jgi:hypothetical protein
MSERFQIALQVGIVVLVLASAVYGIATSAATPLPKVTAPSVGPDASLIASTLRSPTPTPSPLPTPSPSPAPTFVTLPPSAAASPTPRPPALRPYSLASPHCFCVGVDLARGWTATAPFDGTLERHVYQLINGVIREGTDVAGTPSYPYVIVVAVDGRRITFRPGALGTDTQLIADRSPVRAGDDLFKVIGDGPSSWREFYDKSVSFQIVVSLTASNGTDLDPTNLIRFK